MVKFYILQITMGTMTIEEVPEKWREKVEAELESKNVGA